uniref:Uncharacterized protein n=1 Tax=Caenorhabditis japonica TaxID=281687 RepID=A0A8R1HUL7_CAEJA
MYHEEVEFSSLFIAVESVTLAILLTVVVVSFFVYFIEIQIILSFRNTSFKGPFYRLMFVGIIVDMISAVNLFTGQVIPAKV